VREEVRRIIRDPDFPAPDINRAINSVISSLNRLPGRFKFQQSSLLLTLEEGVKEYSVPGLISEELLVFEIDSEEERIIRKAPDLITPYSQGWFEKKGSPEFYVKWGNKIWLNPLPDTSGEEVTVLGYFQVPLLSSDTSLIPLDEQYCISILAWGAASEINPNLVIESSGKQVSISSIYTDNLRNMIRKENYEPMVSYNILRDDRWRGISRMGHVGRIR
jgi:hypothetical protein